MCREEGKREKEIKQQLSYPYFEGIKRFISTKFEKRLGGAWDTKNASGVVGMWHKNTNVLRNSIVHEGYEPTFQEVDLSLEAARNLRLFAVDLVKKKSKEYPRCNSFIYKEEDIES